jgi:hypothetical protein
MSARHNDRTHITLVAITVIHTHTHTHTHTHMLTHAFIDLGALSFVHPKLKVPSVPDNAHSNSSDTSPTLVAVKI